MSTVHVLVQVGEEQYALAVEHVCNVFDLGDLTPIPGSSDSVLGLRNVNGEILPVFDLAKLLNTEGEGRPRRLLVSEHHGQQAALAVDDVLAVAPLTGAMQASDSAQLEASMVIDGVMVGLIAVDVLFESISGEYEK